MDLLFKVGDIICEKDPPIKKALKYKVIAIFQNQWGDHVYELECLAEQFRGCIPYRPKELAKFAHDVFSKDVESVADERSEVW